MKRELGCVEKIAWLRNKSAPNNFLISLELEGEVDENSVKAVLEILQKKYPPLQVRVEEISVGNPYFIDDHVESIPLHFVYIDLNTNIYDFILNELAYNIPINVGPLARISCLVSKENNLFYLIVLMNHIICDGVAIAFFATDLLHMLDTFIHDTNKTSFIGYDKRPPVESYFYNQINNNEQFEQQILNLNLCNEFINKHNLSCISFPTDRLQTRFITHTFSEHESKLLLQNTKKNNITLTNIICAAYIQAFYDYHINEKCFKYANEDINIIYNIPMNLRPYCKTPEGYLTSEDMGCFTSSIDIIHQLKKEYNIWELAKRINMVFNKKVQDNYHLLKMYMRMMVAKETGDNNIEDESVFLNYIKQTRGMQENIPQLFLSNIGKIKFSEQYSKFSLKAMNFIVSVHDILRTNNSYAILAYTNEANNCISLTMPFSFPVINQVQIESMLFHIINNLKKSLN